jgi:hypothetical protein
MEKAMRRSASLLTLMCLSSLFLLPASSATEGGPALPTVQGDQSDPASPGTQTAAGRTKPVFSDGPFRAIVQPRDEESEECGIDGMRLLVLEGTRALTFLDYCSAYVLGSARAVIDRRGRRYVLLERYEGRGTRATSGFLTVYEFNGQRDGYLNERATLLKDEPTGWEATSMFHYQVETPTGGGIVIHGAWTVDGEMRGWGRPPDRSRTLLALDTQG